MSNSKLYNLQKSFNIDDCKDVEDITKGYRGEISGFLSVGDVIDKSNEIISKQALEKALEKAKHRKSNIPFLFEHQYDQMIGSSEISKTAILEENGGLRIVAKFDLSDLAQEKYEEVKKGNYKALSIGASYRASDISKKYNGRGKPITIYNEIIIKEASLVKNPCNQNAIIDIVKSADVELFANVMSRKEWKSVVQEWIFKEMTNAQLEKLFYILSQKPEIDLDSVDDMLSFNGYNIDSEDLLKQMINSIKNILTIKNNMQNNIQSASNTGSASNTLKLSALDINPVLLNKLIQGLKKS
jgi:HK97 family phage prohead protease